MKTTPTALTVTNLVEPDERSGADRSVRITPARASALTVTPVAERDERRGTGRGVTMYNEAGKADPASSTTKPH